MMEIVRGVIMFFGFPFSITKPTRQWADVRKPYKITARLIRPKPYLADIRPNGECQAYLESRRRLYLVQVFYARAFKH